MNNNVNDKILLPNGRAIERKYEKALIMDEAYQNRYEELIMSNTKGGAVLMYVHSKMDKNGKLVSNLDCIAEALNFSRSTVARAVAFLKDEFSDLVAVDKQHNVSRFSVDTRRCFKA